MGARKSAELNEPIKPAVADKTLEDWLVMAMQRQTGAQVDAFLESRGRDAESLVSMFKLTSDHALLKEAMRDYPDDVLVQSTVVLHESESEPEFSKWAARWVEFDPDNALAHYMSASLKAKDDPAGAVEDLVAVMSLHGNHDHGGAFMINQSAFYESIGMPAPVAQAAATQVGTPAIGSLRKSARALATYASDQREAGGQEAADRASAAVLAMGQRYTQEHGTILENLVGVPIEKIVLKDYEEADEIPAFLDRSVGDYRESLDASMADLRGLMKNNAFEKMQALSNQSDLQEYLRRLSQLGEASVQQWVNQKMNASP